MNPKQAYSIGNSNQIRFMKDMNEGFDKDRNSKNGIDNSHPSYSQLKQKQK